MAEMNSKAMYKAIRSCAASEMPIRKQTGL